MSKEKQIEEMAEIIHKADENCAFAFPNSLIESLNKHGRYRVNEAIEFYNSGYRKQSEGEWIKKDGFLVCSKCDATKPIAFSTALKITYYKCNYCPKCGAKMKDGE